MPIYEYECANCNHRLETIQKVSDTPLSRCPECKKPTLQRVISKGTSFRLKGAGWYKPTTVLD